MENLYLPANPMPKDRALNESYKNGLTKLEFACIELRIPDTGDDELNELIAQAQRRDLAAKALQGILAYPHGGPHEAIEIQENIAIMAVKYADAILAELESSNQSNSTT